MAESTSWPIRRVISGGQTGVDRAALDAAMTLGIDHGGWCPKGRLAEDGTIPGQYQLSETKSVQYPVRTERNVLDSDGTLILFLGRLYGGTLLTLRLTQTHGKPSLLQDLAQADVGRTRQWLGDHGIGVLNVAGPRESSACGVRDLAYTFLLQVLQEGPVHNLSPEPAGET